MSELKVLKIATPDLETVFLGNNTLDGKRLKTPTEIGHLIPLNAALRRSGRGTVRLQLLRALIYPGSGEHQQGLLIATKESDALKRLLGAHIVEPQDELCGEVLMNTVEAAHADLVHLRIERVRLEIHRINDDELKSFRGAI